MTTINEISNHIMSYFDGTLDAFGYTAQSVNEISNPDESIHGNSQPPILFDSLAASELIRQLNK